MSGLNWASLHKKYKFTGSIVDSEKNTSIVFIKCRCKVYETKWNSK